MTFNSKEYSWCQLHAYMLGREVGGARAVEYTTKKTKEALYATGAHPRSIQHGRRECEGTLTLLQSEFIALNDVAVAGGYEDIMDVEFDLVVSYISSSGVTVTDIVRGVSITELPHSLKEGDLYMEIALPFVALDVQHGA